MTTSTGPDVLSSLPSWVGVSQHNDLHEELSGLLATARTGARDANESESIGLAQAELDLLQGRPTEALTALAAVPASPASGAIPAWSQLLTDACRAATGDGEAFARVRGMAARPLAAGDKVAMTYLLAASGAGAGDPQAADAAWLDLPTRLGHVTAFTLEHWAAAKVRSRDQVDPTACAASVVAGARAFDALPVPLAADPTPALRAADLLLERGDPAGARLLLQAVQRTRARLPMVEERLLALRPPEAKGYALKRGLVIAVAFCLLAPLTLAGILIARVGAYLWSRFIPLPGMSRVDSRTSRAVAQLRYNPITDKVESTGGEVQLTAYDVLAVLVSAGLGGGAAALLHLLLTGHPTASVLIGLGFVVGAAAWGFRAGRQWQHSHALRRLERRRQVALRAQRGDVAHCACWQVSLRRGLLAEAYAEDHLEEVPLNEPLPLIGLELPRLARCAATEILWLRTRSGERTVLLRGSGPTPEEAPRQDDAPTGMYL